MTGVAAGVLAGAVLAGLAPAQAQEAKGWESSASVGATLSRGNSHSFTANLGVDSKRKWSKDEVLLGANAGFGENTPRTGAGAGTRTVSERYIKGNGQWNHLFTERLFGGLRVDAVADAVADIDYRLTLSPLLGYYFIKSPNTSLQGYIGPAYVVEKVGGNGARGYAGLRLGERFDHKFANGARIWQTVDITPEIELWENYVVNFEVGVEAPLTKALSTRLVLQDTYDNQPAAGRLKNDLKLIAGLAYKF